MRRCSLSGGSRIGHAFRRPWDMFGCAPPLPSRTSAVFSERRKWYRNSDETTPLIGCATAHAWLVEASIPQIETFPIVAPYMAIPTDPLGKTLALLFLTPSSVSVSSVSRTYFPVSSPVFTQGISPPKNSVRFLLGVPPDDQSATVRKVVAVHPFGKSITQPTPHSSPTSPHPCHHRTRRAFAPSRHGHQRAPYPDRRAQW